MANDFFEIIRHRIQATGMSQAQFARETGVQQGSLSRFLKGEQSSLSGDTVAKIVAFLGARLVFPGEDSPEPARDVCWVNARIMPAGEHVAPPVAEDYLAAPLVGEVGAGPGYLPQESVESWFLVYKHVPAIMGRRNLIAVEIGKTSTSMLPLLSPGDIVLVDRDDIDVSHAGHIMLVRDPEGAGMVKRVSVQPTPGSKDFSIQFYSDNAATNPPLLYSLREDYGGEISNGIVGRVIWAWSDVRTK